jgi:alkanesulfonate monooxygenase SsuD/methylene tetrahydromethanopterin reductase-like flavin-dependent oxidoreductase (luciferase family)
VPIYTTATSERALRFAAEHADGAFLPICPPLGYVRWALEVIRDALPPGKSFEVAADIHLRVDDDIDAARASVRPLLAYYFSRPMYREVLRRSGRSASLGDAADETSGVRRLIDADRDSLDSFHGEDLDRAGASLSDEFVDECAVVGDLATCRKRLAELAEVGLTEVVLSFQQVFDETIGAIANFRPVRPSRP